MDMEISGPDREVGRCTRRNRERVQRVFTTEDTEKL